MDLRFALPAALAATVLMAPGTMAEESSPIPAFSINDHTADPMTAAVRAVLGGAGEHGSFADKRDAAAVAEYYSERGFELAWITDGVLNDRGRAIATKLRGAKIDGLDPRAYPTPPDHGYLDLLNVARADVMLTHSVVTYARHAYGGRVNPSKISSDIDYEANILDPIEALSDIIGSDDPVAALDALNPQHPEFQALRVRLAEVRADRSERPPFLPAGRAMKLGSKNARVAILRQRLKITDEVEEAELFDETVDEAVKSYQESASLTVDGIVGPGTLGSLNQAAQDHESVIISNMERWRWMPREMGRLYVRVNVPNFNLEIIRDGDVFHTTRIVVGKPKFRTPIFSDEIEHVIVNPTWNIPASIARNEFLPTLRQNRGSLKGYNVYANIKGRFRKVDPTFINWSNVDMKKIQIKQPPGNTNALGQVKFMFPNKHAVYLHDTPSKSLFKKDYRAYSHGCMRVNNPWEFANYLLDADPGITGELVHNMVGGREQQLNLEEHIPVHVTYFTAWVDGDGELQVRGDLYGHDMRVQKALGLS